MRIRGQGAEELAQGATDGMEDREEFVSLLRHVREAKTLNVSGGQITRDVKTQ